MTIEPRPHVSIDDEDGRLLASADIHVVDPSATRASLHVEPGHLPPGTRAHLVDAVLDDPGVSARPHVQVTLPLGETEMLDRVRERCDTVETRAAGASCLVDADLPDAAPGSTDLPAAAETQSGSHPQA